LVITSNQEDGNKKLKDNLEPMKTIEKKDEGTNCIKDDDDEENFEI